MVVLALARLPPGDLAVLVRHARTTRGRRGVHDDRSGRSRCSTGEVTPVELFVGVLGASNYTFAEATMTQRSADFIGSHLRMLEFFGGAPAAVVPDQLKSGVVRSCWYDPKIQRTYEAMAEHYGTTVMPARPGTMADPGVHDDRNPQAGSMATDFRVYQQVELGELHEELGRLRLCEAAALTVMERSLMTLGQITPLVVHAAARGYEVLDGFKRVRAARALK